MARSAHHGHSRRGDTDIQHPLGVAQLLSERGFDETVIAARKAEARNRVLIDRRAAAIYAADKVVNTREMLVSREDIPGERLDHYIKTLRVLSAGRPDLPFLSELSLELTTLVDREAG